MSCSPSSSALCHNGRNETEISSARHPEPGLVLSARIYCFCKLASQSQLVRLCILLLNINNFPEHQHETRPLCDLCDSRQKQDHSVIVCEPRQNTNSVQTTKVTKHFLILADINDCYFFIHLKSLSLNLVLPPPR